MTVADLELRPATLDDAAVVADIDTEVSPDDAEDPVMTRHWWTMAAAGDVIERQIALREGTPVGYTMFRHPSWAKMPERFARITAELRPAVRTAERLGALYDVVEGRARADG